MRVKFTVLSLAMLLSSVTFAWGLFGPSAKDVESAFIERWEPTTHFIGLNNRVKEKLEMKSVKATKTDRKGIWKVTYTLAIPYVGGEDTAQNKDKDRSSNTKSQQKDNRGTTQEKPSEPRSILDQVLEVVPDTKIKYERVRYFSVYSVYKQDGKLVLKSLPIPSDLN